MGIIDYTRTAVGSRLLKNWLEKPLLNKAEIQKRLDTTEELVNDTTLRLSFKEHLEPVYDLERIVSRIAYGTANAKDLLALKNSFNVRMPVRSRSLCSKSTSHCLPLTNTSRNASTSWQSVGRR